LTNLKLYEKNLDDIMEGKNTEKDLKIIPKSFDVIGSREKAVAAIEIPDGLKDKEKAIAESIMIANKNVKSVLKKSSEIKGELRLRDFELIDGDANTEVFHKEYGYKLKVDLQKVYFSPRESTERQIIASRVKPNETVLVMFSGIAPFPIAIVKKQPEVKKVYGIELNETAHRYGVENVRINKLGHKIVLIHGDVKKICPGYKGRFDRIVMPLPLEAENFLDVAISCLKENGVIHFYNCGNEDDLFSKSIKIIEGNCKRLSKKYKILDKRKVLPYSPRKWKICIEFMVEQG
jgi:tRNA (guanine37-N1)-methyltransferase